MMFKFVQICRVVLHDLLKEISSNLRNLNRPLCKIRVIKKKKQQQIFLHFFQPGHVLDAFKTKPAKKLTKSSQKFTIFERTLVKYKLSIRVYFDTIIIFFAEPRFVFSVSREFSVFFNFRFVLSSQAYCCGTEKTTISCFAFFISTPFRARICVYARPDKLAN